jgi:hypothetical protein
MSTMDRIANAQGLWTLLLPDFPRPEPRQFHLWVGRFTDPQIERALLRASRKFAGHPRETEPGRYVTGVLLNLERETRGPSDSPRAVLPATVSH